MVDLDDKLTQIYQQSVMNHSRQPHNFGSLQDADRIGRGRNRLCGDVVHLYLRFQSGSGQHIDQISFDGESCAICRASASMLTDELTGMSLDEALIFLDRLEQFVSDWTVDPSIGEFAALQVLQQYPTRLKCLRLPWQACRQALLDGDGCEVTTERQEKEIPE